MTDTVTLTYLFTDLESSTRLWERHPETMPRALARHDEILRNAVQASDGIVVKTTGDGLMAVFSDAAPAVRASLQAQEQLQSEAWEQPESLKVRMGIHAGVSTPRDGDYYGSEVNRAARVMAAGHGGQILTTREVVDRAGAFLESAIVKELGTHRLKDLAGNEELFQITWAGMPESFPPVSTLDLRPNNLPSQPSTFVGRDSEIAELTTLLRNDQVRLVTLTGPGGTGKTRLALQGAADRIDWFDDGVFFVDLSSQREAEAAYRTIVRTIGVDTESEDHALDSLLKGLRNSAMLLILDNFEQVTDAAEGVVRLLAGCHRLQVIVTSREALRVRGEHVFTVSPLPTPDSADEDSVESVARSAAAQMFIDRASAAGNGFSLTPENASAVASICRRLDGLPLALELAAARLDLFTPAELDRKLDSRLDVLKAGARDLPVRQQTLRSTVEWSVELLSEPEQKTFAVFSCFEGASLDAFEAVVDELEITVDATDNLGSLIRKSLVRSEDGPLSTRRFRMLDTLRDYASELLRSMPDLESATRLAHAATYRDRAVALSPRRSGDRQDVTLNTLGVDLDNYRSSWQYWLLRRDRTSLIGLMDTLWSLHEAMGWYDGIIDLADDMLSVLVAEEPTPDRTREEVGLQMSVARAIMAVRGYTPEVEERFNAALALSEDGEATHQRFPVLRSLASLHFARTEHAKGKALGLELVALAEAQNDRALESEAHYILGSNLVMLNDFDDGMRHLERSIALFDPAESRTERFRLGPSPGVVALTTSAFIKFFLCLSDQAQVLAGRALDIAQALEHPLSQAYAYYHVGLLHLWRQDITAAMERATELRTLADTHDYDLWRSLAMVIEGICRIASGDADEGERVMERGVTIYLTLKTPPGFTSGLFMLRSMGYGMAGRPESALDAMSQALEHALGSDQTPFTAMSHLAMGDIRLSLVPADVGTAQDHYATALELARSLGVLGPELEAATRLAQLHAGTPSELESRNVLQSVYDQVTEGFLDQRVAAARAQLEQG